MPEQIMLKEKLFNVSHWASEHTIISVLILIAVIILLCVPLTRCCARIRLLGIQNRRNHFDDLEGMSKSVPHIDCPIFHCIENASTKSSSCNSEWCIPSNDTDVDVVINKNVYRVPLSLVTPNHTVWKWEMERRELRNKGRNFLPKRSTSLPYLGNLYYKTTAGKLQSLQRLPLTETLILKGVHVDKATQAEDCKYCAWVKYKKPFFSTSFLNNYAKESGLHLNPSATVGQVESSNEKKSLEVSVPPLQPSVSGDGIQEIQAHAPVKNRNLLTNSADNSKNLKENMILSSIDISPMSKSFEPHKIVNQTRKTTTKFDALKSFHRTDLRPCPLSIMKTAKTTAQSEIQRRSHSMFSFNYLYSASKNADIHEHSLYKSSSMDICVITDPTQHSVHAQESGLYLNPSAKSSIESVNETMNKSQCEHITPIVKEQIFTATKNNEYESSSDEDPFLY